MNYLLRFFTKECAEDDVGSQEKLLADFTTCTLPMIPSVNSKVLLGNWATKYKVKEIFYGYPSQKGDANNLTYAIDVWLEEEQWKSRY